MIVCRRDGVSPAWGDPDGDHIDRFIRKDTVVDAPVADVWRSWTTEEGVRFMAEGARIDAVPGGPYEWYFSLDAPAGSRGGEGNTVLSIEPPRMLAFEWNAPPHHPEVRKKKHQVVIQLEPSGDRQTHLVLTSLGFGTGQEWRDVHAYFEEAGDAVLGRLKASFE